MLILVAGVLLVVVAAVAYFVLFKSPVTTTVHNASVCKDTNCTAASCTSKKTDNAKDEKPKGPPMSIFFGSQSGTAETLAFELVDEANAYGFAAQAIDLEDYEPEELCDEKFCVFLMATFGEGEPTDNAVSFFEWFVSKGEEGDDTWLAGIDFATFALGNRQYEMFCTTGIQTDKIFGKMSGNRLVECGQGDDDGSLEDDYETWKTKFWDAARQKYGLAASAEVKFQPKWKFTMLDETPDGTPYKASRGQLQDRRYFSSFAPVTLNRELRQDASDGLSTVHLELDVKGKQALRYMTADNLGVFPRNDFKAAAQMTKRLGARPDQLFRMQGSSKFVFPSPCSVMDAFLWHIDFQSTPRLPLLKTLSQYTSDPKEKAKLLSYTEEQGKDFHKDQKSLKEIFEEFPSMSPPLEAFLEFAPKLVPRYYTISSSSKADKDTLSITVAWLKSPKPRGREYQGICSTFLCGLNAGKDSLCCFVRPSSFRLPKQITSASVIMIGPGTGIAPFRAFVQEFTHAEKPKEAWLFFGCRNSQQDYIYKDELELAESTKVLDQLPLAFSREQQHKVYVQDRLKEHKDKVWEMISKDKAYVFVCGATQMGRSVKDVLLQMAQDSGMTQDEAGKYIEQMSRSQRYVAELWS